MLFLAVIGLLNTAAAETIPAHHSHGESVLIKANETITLSHKEICEDLATQLLLAETDISFASEDENLAAALKGFTNSIRERLEKAKCE